ncbi:signal peptidase I [Kitasatospora sp. KL5]|uniref:signal peptidase I n=1 Tax=Kitasatospora sp. KL5 TaxID=3425125 RepID=UPI003D6F3761
MARRRRTPVWVAAGMLAAGLAAAAPAATVLATRYELRAVSGPAMAPTLEPGGVVLTERASAADVRRGDLLLLDVPVDPAGTPTGLQVKRLIGTGGDSLGCCGANGLRRNGERIDEPYARGTARTFSVHVRPHRLFVLGDNRDDSIDSQIPDSFGDVADGTIADSTVRGRVVWASDSTVDAPGAGSVRTLVRVTGAGTTLTLLGLLALPVTLLATRRRRLAP